MSTWDIDIYIYIIDKNQHNKILSCIRFLWVLVHQPCLSLEALHFSSRKSMTIVCCSYLHPAVTLELSKAVRNVRKDRAGLGGFSVRGGTWGKDDAIEWIQIFSMFQATGSIRRTCGILKKVWQFLTTLIGLSCSTYRCNWKKTSCQTTNDQSNDQLTFEDLPGNPFFQLSLCGLAVHADHRFLYILNPNLSPGFHGRLDSVSFF